MKANLLRLAYAFMFLVMSSAGVSLVARADSITLSGTVVGSGSDKTDDDHAKGYSGEYTVKFDYTIATKKNPDGTTVFDPSGMSTVTLTDTSEKFGSFTTLPIKITSANFAADGSLTSFGFSSTDWYPNAASDGIKNNGLTGMITVLTNESTITSSYIDNSSGSIYTYKFSAVPEPSEWALLLTGSGVAWAWIVRRRRAGADARV